MSTVQKHESSADFGVYLSDNAKKHVYKYLEQHNCQGMRLSVKKTGCSGLSYVIDYVNAKEENDLVFPLSKRYIVCVDKKSYPFLKGLHIDYVKEGLNNKFIFKNPNQTGECGCGESFTVE